MNGGALVSMLVLCASILAGCAGAPVREGETVVQFIDIGNESGEPVEVTARVGASEEQRLGFLGPGERRRFDLETGASSSGSVFLRARNPQTGQEATETLQVSPGETLQWSIRF